MAQFDMNLFVTSIYTRLAASMSATSTDTFTSIFSILNPSTTIAKFKMALCQKYLTASSSPAGTIIQPNARPKPQARAPRPVRASGNVPVLPKDTAQEPGCVTTAIASKFVLPQPSDILELVNNSMNGMASSSQSLRVKFELLASYVLVQKTMAIDERPHGLEWDSMAKDGKLHRTVDSVFAGDENLLYRESLKVVLGLDIQ